MAYTIAFFGSKPYDEASFNDKNKEYGFVCLFINVESLIDLCQHNF